MYIVIVGSIIATVLALVWNSLRLNKEIARIGALLASVEKKYDEQCPPMVAFDALKSGADSGAEFRKMLQSHWAKIDEANGGPPEWLTPPEKRKSAARTAGRMADHDWACDAKDFDDSVVDDTVTGGDALPWCKPVHKHVSVLSS